MSAVLRAEGLWKRFGDQPVLRGVSLELSRHEVVAVIGSSGSGKSTLLRCLNLLESIDDLGDWVVLERVTCEDHLVAVGWRLT